MSEVNKNCGIYQIRNIITRFCYTGQSIRLRKRPGEHWSDLKHNRHENSYLQNSYNKYGKEFFVFEILIYCKPEELTYYEQLFCDIDKRNGLSYNIRICVNSNKGLKHTLDSIELMKEAARNISDETREKRRKARLGKKHSPETIEKLKNAKKNISYKTKMLMSKNHANVKGKNNPMFGKHHSNKTRKKISENHVDQIGINSPRIIKKEVVLEVQKLLKAEMSGASVAKELNIDRHTVYKIRDGFYDKMYNLTKQKYIPRKIIKKAIVLQAIKMLKNDILIKNIIKDLKISRTTVYRIKNGFYNDKYNL